MNTIFWNNKFQVGLSGSQQISLANMPTSSFQLTRSFSPQKQPSAKKFFLPLFNQSLKEDDNPAKKNLQDIIRRQKIVLSSHKASKSPFNQILFSPEMLMLHQSDLITFPSLEVKSKSPIFRRHRQKTQLPELKIQTAQQECHSNILGNLQAVASSDKNQSVCKSERKTESPNKKVSLLQKMSKKYSLLDADSRSQNEQIYNSQCFSPSPTLMNRMKSQTQIDAALTQKKYKKGYLAYEEGGLEFWEKMKKNIEKPGRIKVDNRIVTAKYFYALDLNTLEPVLSYRAEEEIEIASVSKIMTCYLTILIGRKYQVDLKECWYRVPDWITQTPGTSAQLQAGDIISAYDLLFALMLPSGNDASICLAELMGKVIQRHRKKDPKRSYFQTFLSHMNLFSKELDLPQQWGNSHGLSNNPNITTARAIVSLTALALRDEVFRMVINTKEYEVVLKNDRYGLSNRRAWKNTNRLLEKGWQGVKTGTTDSAGHCLMALKGPLLLGVFDCQTLSRRFSDSIRLHDVIVTHPHYN